MIKRLNQIRGFLKASKTNGWFDQWQKSGDVVSGVDRGKIRRETARQNIAKLQDMLKEGGK